MSPPAPALHPALRGRLTAGDAVVLALSLAGLVALAVQLWGADARPDTALVRIDGREVLRLSLAEAGQYAVEGPAGTRRVEVRDGRIRCVSSPAPQHLCERAGWLSHAGEVAVGLPNRVSIEVLGRNRRFDSISY